MAGGYESIYQWQVGRLAGCDLEANAAPLGLAVAGPGLVRLPFLNRDFLVDREGARPADGRPAGFARLSLAVHYAQSSGRGEPAYEFLPLSRLTGQVPGQPSAGRASLGRDSFNAALARRFDPDPEGLAAAAAALGGRRTEGEASGGQAWLFHAFPKIPLKLMVQAADEEFESDYRLLFDSAAVAFLEFEALGFLAGIFEKEITAWPGEPIV